MRKGAQRRVPEEARLRVWEMKLDHCFSLYAGTSRSSDTIRTQCAGHASSEFGLFGAMRCFEISGRFGCRRRSGGGTMGEGWRCTHCEWLFGSKRNEYSFWGELMGEQSGVEVSAEPELCLSSKIFGRGD